MTKLLPEFSTSTLQRLVVAVVSETEGDIASIHKLMIGEEVTTTQLIEAFADIYFSHSLSTDPYAQEVAEVAFEIKEVLRDYRNISTMSDVNHMIVDLLQNEIRDAIVAFGSKYLS